MMLTVVARHLRPPRHHGWRLLVQKSNTVHFGHEDAYLRTRGDDFAQLE